MKVSVCIIITVHVGAQGLSALSPHGIWKCPCLCWISSIMSANLFFLTSYSELWNVFWLSSGRQIRTHPPDSNSPNALDVVCWPSFGIFLKLYHLFSFLKKAITYNLKVHFDIKQMKTSCSSLNINGIFSKYISKWLLHLAQFSPPTTTSCFLPVLSSVLYLPSLKAPRSVSTDIGH